MTYTSLTIEHLAYAVRRAHEYPSAVDLYTRLEEIEALARRARLENARSKIEREVTDPVIFGLLADGDPKNEAVLVPMLRRANGLVVFRKLNLAAVGRLAAAARARQPRKQGRRIFYPDPRSGPNELEYCALIVTMAWYRDAGRWPGQSNPTAQLICELLRRTAGGVPHGDIAACDGQLTAWRKHLRAAQRYKPPHHAGTQIYRAIDFELFPAAPRRALSFDPGRLRVFYDHPATP